MVACEWEAEDEECFLSVSLAVAAELGVRVVIVRFFVKIIMLWLLKGNHGTQRQRK